MSKKIFDKFTFATQKDGKPMSRQQKWILRQAEASRCRICGEPANRGAHCVKHAILDRESKRAKAGSLRRNLRAASYARQEAAEKEFAKKHRNNPGLKKYIALILLRRKARQENSKAATPLPPPPIANINEEIPFWRR